MIKISSRLESLTKYISNEDKIMDVGCDHALLDIYMVEAGIVSSCYVGDVNVNALNNGIENIKRHNLEKSIFPVLSYGIEKISSLDVNTLIISGMGTKNIMDILSSPNLDRIYKLILQSNNNYPELRRYLTKRGFNIFAEEVVKDGKKVYINIVAGRDYQTKTYTDMEYEYGPLLINDPANINYFEELRDNFEDLHFQSRNDKYKEQMQEIEKIIDNLRKKQVEF